MGARLCASCKKRPALYAIRSKQGAWKIRADRDHDMCFACYRNTRHSMWAKAMKRAAQRRYT